ncbi:HlyD family efflux transporter periplasmic adaptor subunit [Desulfosporosinus fructosivorans]|uniref:HlyD family efflux transporter periplasmic adaptor subunit n=1 Tax=Desulfosporosinus fructosivorans TaxID=2018669 RepID=A0A4Z0R9M1_9FIRM|nr:efflux RND transporter periplasmic adaptor subunit [Desulfosporosinus fructosivorans]TGE39154.1 HlyD family efflux transporter periplasmic adaptor subunit [Desulfosporosinus fructosivorans]
MRKLLTIGLIGLLILSISGCGKETEKNEDESAAKVETKQVIEAFGTVKSTEVKNITIDFLTVVTKVNVVEGQSVKKGDSLVSLDSQNYLTQIRNRELELQTLQRELSGLSRDYEVNKLSLDKNTDPDIMKYINDQKHAEDLLNIAMGDLTAREALYNAGALSLSELNEFKKTVNEKKKSVEDAVFSEETTRKKIQQEMDQLKTSIEQKIPQITSKELDLKAMQEKMNKSYFNGNDVIADVPNGVVTEIGCVQGDIIADDEGKKLLSVLNKDSVVIEADVAEEFIKDVRIGAKVIINPQADKARTYNGKVLFIAEKAVLKNNETIIPVRISIENLDSFLLPEFNVDVKIDFESKKQS